MFTRPPYGPAQAEWKKVIVPGPPTTLCEAKGLAQNQQPQHNHVWGPWKCILCDDSSASSTNSSDGTPVFIVANEANGVSWGAIHSYATQIIPVIPQYAPVAVILIGTHSWGF